MSGYERDDDAANAAPSGPANREPSAEPDETVPAASDAALPAPADGGPDSAHAAADPGTLEAPATEDDDEHEAEPALSPSVRRLVKQYGLDVTAVRGTGPDGRLRIGDVMALIGDRDGPAENQGASRATRAREPAARTVREPAFETEPAGEVAPPAARDAAAAAAAGTAEPATTTVFECDAGRVLEDQRRHREQGREIALSAYFVAGFARALRETHALAAQRGHRIPALGIDTRDGTHVLTDADTATVEQISVALNAPVVTCAQPVVLVRHHGLGGSLLVQSDRLASAHTAVLGIGSIRRQVVVRVADGDETPRIASRCLLSLTFRESVIELRAANELLARCVANVERWRVAAAPGP